MEESLSIYMLSLHKASLIQNSIVYLYCSCCSISNFAATSLSTHLPLRWCIGATSLTCQRKPSTVPTQFHPYLQKRLGHIRSGSLNPLGVLQRCPVRLHLPAGSVTTHWSNQTPWKRTGATGSCPALSHGQAQPTSSHNQQGLSPKAAGMNAHVSRKKK